MLEDGDDEAEPNDEPTPGLAPVIAEATSEISYIPDYISKLPVRATPEEVEAVQVMARRLVEEYGYPVEHIQTRPQFRVRKSPGASKSYPVDIAVFKSGEHREDTASILVECKRNTRKDGIGQLTLYLDMSPTADLGVWFNGSDHEYLRKVFDGKGNRRYESLPNIPRFGQSIDDIGKYTRAELVKPTNLKWSFASKRGLMG